MEFYLTIITTILVLTQITRITQNTISLHNQTKLIKEQLNQIREIGDEDIVRKMEIDKMLVELIPKMLIYYSYRNCSGNAQSEEGAYEDRDENIY